MSKSELKIVSPHLGADENLIGFYGERVTPELFKVYEYFLKRLYASLGIPAHFFGFTAHTLAELEEHIDKVDQDMQLPYPKSPQEVKENKMEYMPLTQGEVLEAIRQAKEAFGDECSLRYIVVHPKQYEEVVLMPLNGVSVYKLPDDTVLATDRIVCVSGNPKRTFLWNREIGFQNTFRIFGQGDFLTVLCLVKLPLEEIEGIYVSEKQWRIRNRTKLIDWCSALRCNPAAHLIHVVSMLNGKWLTETNDEIAIRTRSREIIVCERYSDGWRIKRDDREWAKQLETKCKEPSKEESEVEEYQYTHSAKFVFPDGTEFEDGCFGPTFEIPEPDPNEGWKKVIEVRPWPMRRVVDAMDGKYYIESYDSEEVLLFNHDIGGAAAKEYRKIAVHHEACCVSFTTWQRLVVEEPPVYNYEKLRELSLLPKGKWPKRRPEECNPGMNEMMRHFTGKKVGEE